MRQCGANRVEGALYTGRDVSVGCSRVCCKAAYSIQCNGHGRQPTDDEVRQLRQDWLQKGQELLVADDAQDELQQLRDHRRKGEVICILVHLPQQQKHLSCHVCAPGNKSSARCRTAADADPAVPTNFPRLSSLGWKPACWHNCAHTDTGSDTISFPCG